MFGREEIKFYLRFYNLADKIIGDDINFPICEDDIEKFCLPEDTAYIKIHDKIYYSMCDENSLMIYIGKRLSHEEFRTGDYEMHSCFERAFRRGQIGWPRGNVPDFCYICKSEDKPKDISMVSYLEDNAIVVSDKEKLKKLIIEISKELIEKDKAMMDAGLSLRNYGVNDFIRTIGLDYNKKSI